MAALRVATLLLCLLAGFVDARELGLAVTTSVDLGGYLETLEDADGALTAEAVEQHYREGLFRPLPESLSAGYTEAAIWLTFRLRNPAEQPINRLLAVPPAHLDEVRLYQHSEGRWQSRVLGDDQPWAQRGLRDRLAVFPLTLEPGASERFFLRIQSQGNVAAVPQIYTPEDYFWRAQIGMFFYGGLLITGLVVVLSNLLQWWMLRQRVYLLYAIFVAVSTGYLLLVEAVLHVLWSPAASFVAAPWVTVLHGGIMLSSHLFMREVIRLRRHLPLLDTLLFGLAAGVFVAGCISVLFGWDLYVKPWMWGAFVLQVVIGLSAAAWLGLWGNRAALQYFLAFIATAIGVLISATAVLGLHDQAVEHNVGNTLTALIHMALMQLVTIATARREQLTREQREAIELETATRIKARLEQEVRSRTEAWREANEKLQEEVGRGQLLAARLEHAKAQLEQTLAEQRQLTEEQKNFMRMVAHEFRTPLAVISSSSEMIEAASSSTLTDLSRRSLQRQRRAVLRLKDLIERALAFEEINDSAWTLRLESVDLQALLRDLLAQPGIESDGRLTFGADLVPCMLQADRQLLEVLFGNLFDNAVKYSRDGGHVQVRSWLLEGAVRVVVEDEGPGVPEREHDRVFRKFARGAEVNAPGFGIGLYMVRRIAESHGGRVELENRTTGGARLSVTLPLAVRPVAAEGRAPKE